MRHCWGPRVCWVLRTAHVVAVVPPFIPRRAVAAVRSLDSSEDRSGSTCVSLFLTETHIVFANVGDSRAFLTSASTVRFATEDHKPTNPEENRRICAADGFVEMGRVCGNLAVSRALGDYMYKDVPRLSAEEQKVSADADVTVLERSPRDEFVVLACDGIFDVMTSQEVSTFVTQCIEASLTLEATCEHLLDNCLNLGSKVCGVLAVLVSVRAPLIALAGQYECHHCDTSRGSKAHTWAVAAQVGTT